MFVLLAAITWCSVGLLLWFPSLTPSTSVNHPVHWPTIQGLSFQNNWHGAIKIKIITTQLPNNYHAYLSTILGCTWCRWSKIGVTKQPKTSLVNTTKKLLIFPPFYNQSVGSHSPPLWCLISTKYWYGAIELAIA